MKRFTQLCAVLLVASTALASAQTAEFRTVPWAAWAGAGTDFDSYSLAVGIRRGPWGLGAGYRRNTKITVPSYSTEAPPAGAGADQTFQASSVGLDLYTVHGIADFINGYAVVGGYADVNTILREDPRFGQWFLSENSPDWTNARVAYGAGLEIAPLDWLVVGLGYHSVRGFNVHLGYSW